jgi:trans-aconitate 2-methyltransferase
MPSWSPEQYLAFEEQRTRPARDLARSVQVENPRRVVDLGCGPGNSTEVCAERWPEASIVGIDSSAAMIEKARSRYPSREWRQADIAEWAREEGGERFDVVFANAALQWVGEHETLFPRLLARVAPGGALAVQMPSYENPANRAMRELAAEASWRTWFPEGRAREWRAYEPDFYYEALATHAARLDLWATEYVQIMPDLAAIVEWYKGTGLRPYLDAIGEEAERERFLTEFADRLRASYPESAAGGVLFPFRRVFVVGYAGAS